MRKFVLALAVLICITCLPLTACSCNGGATSRTKYDITFELNDDYTLKGNERVCFYNDTDNAFTEIKFNIFGNAFRKDAKFSPISAQYQATAYPHGVSYGNMTVNGAKVSGAETDFSIGGIDQNVLIVPLGKEVYPNESVTVEIDFELKLADVIARTGYNDKTVNLANFYPILCGIEDGSFYECVYYASGDPFYSDVADYTVTATVNESYVVAGAGEITASSTKDGKRTDVYKLNRARSFNMVLSKEFECVTDVSTGTRINYYFYDDAMPNKSIDYAIKSVNLFNDKFGKYPYPVLNVVQTKFVQGGMEFPTLVMISDNLSSASYGEVIVHETAHQWWQSVVGNNEIEYGFLDEGLAEYSVVLFYENYPEHGLTRASMIKSAEDTYKVFCSVYDKLFGGVDTTMTRSLAEYGSEYEYVNIAYIKTCIMYDYLRKSVGDELFFKGLRKYYADYKFLNATPYDLVGAYEKVGSSANGFFDSFFNGKVII